MSYMGSVIAAALALGTVALVASTRRAPPVLGDLVVVPLAKLRDSSGNFASPGATGEASVSVAAVTGSTVTGSATGVVDATGKVVDTAGVLGLPIGVPVSFQLGDITGHVDLATKMVRR